MTSSHNIRGTVRAIMRQTFPGGRVNGGLRSVAWVSVVLGLSACLGQKGAVASLREPANTVGTLVLSPLNSVIAIGATLQINTSVLSMVGTPLSSVDSVIFYYQTPADSVRATVSPTGLVTGLAATAGASPVMINALAFKDSLARGDRVLVQVTPTVIAGVTLSIQPSLGDSAKAAVGTYKTITPVIRNPGTGQQVPSPALRLSRNPADIQKFAIYAPFICFGSFISGQCYGAGQYPNADGIGVSMNQIVVNARSGSAWVYAVANVYGAVLRDSVLYTFTNGYSATVSFTADNLKITAPNDIHISPSGTVTFRNSFIAGLGTSIAVVFDNPAGATVATPPAIQGGTTGNIVGLTSSQSTARRFMTTGTYQWTATVSGSLPPFTGVTVTGLIIVE